LTDVHATRDLPSVKRKTVLDVYCPENFMKIYLHCMKSWERERE